MADQMQPTPRSTILGLFSDIVNLPLQYMSSPERTQQMQGTAQFLYETGIPKTLERLSYGDSLFSGAGMTLRPREETINAAMTVAPFAPAVGRVIPKVVRATEGLPVGMSIKDVGKGINVSLNEASNFLSAKSEFGQVGGTIRPPDWFSDKPYLQINYAEVEKASRGKGKGKELYQSLIDEAQARGLRVFSDSTVERPAVNVYKSLEKGGYKLRDMTTGSLEDGAVYGSGATNPAFEISSMPSMQAPQQAALTVKPPTDDVYEVMDATFNYGKLGGNKTIPIDQLTGGVRMNDPTEARRVKELADKISSPEGYISRIIVDDSGNVLEGQHRLEALRLLGEKNVPVAVIEDLSNKYDISAMQNAIQGKLRSDQSNQLIRQAIDTLEEAGSVEKALSDYSMPPMFQQPFQDVIRASQKVKPIPVENLTYTDPFGNTIGSSIR
jgi:GNAT superfamily N-acetyltransferase